jgi:uncharacterized protein YeaO (DUF488 family)
MAIHVKRIYDDAEDTDGARVLVDRVWPRGVSKDRAALDLWCREAAPSTDLRTWFHRDVPGRFARFADRYAAELADNPAVDELRRLAAEHDVLTLLYAAKDTERNNAVVLAGYLAAH